MPPKTRRIFMKKAIKVGNSAGVLLPKKFLGSDVRVIILKRPPHIRKDAVNILEPYLENILGIYIINISEKNIDLIAVSTNIQEIIHKGRYKISIVPISKIKKDLKTQKTLQEKIKQAKPVLNKPLLLELRKNL